MSGAPGRFAGTRVFVTGAGSGIEAATVELLAVEGARVVGVDIVATGSGAIAHLAADEARR